MRARVAAAAALVLVLPGCGAAGSASTSQERPSATFETRDGFRLEVLIGPNGQAHLSVTPCVEKSEVARPTSKPNGPDCSRQTLPEPNVRSTFWSSTTLLPS